MTTLNAYKRMNILKRLLTGILAIGLFNPFCLCGELANTGHDLSAFHHETCGGSDHGHGHGNDGADDRHDSPCPSEDHSDQRGLVKASIVIPACPAPEMAPWNFLLPEPTGFPRVSRPASVDESPPPGDRLSYPERTGVFLL